jgi:hypothetical protein
VNGRNNAALVVLLGAALVPRVAGAFGPLGHRIAGTLAEPALCAAARAEVETLGGGESLAELGLWADRIRSEPEWRASAPWHFMNVDERNATVGAGAAAARRAVRARPAPAEGDVLSAITRFRAELANRSLPARERAAALKFLVHFVVDVHQPLHVGRASDRGGNAVDVRYGDTVVNLHRFWDTDVLELRRLGAERYARTLRPRFAVTTAPASPAEWAAESLALRATVYSFEREAPRGPGPSVLGAAYVAAARAAAEDRVVLAAARLAATLNDIFCPAPPR